MSEAHEFVVWSYWASNIGLKRIGIDISQLVETAYTGVFVNLF